MVKNLFIAAKRFMTEVVFCFFKIVKFPLSNFIFEMPNYKILRSMEMQPLTVVMSSIISPGLLGEHACKHSRLLLLTATCVKYSSV